jgi:hypothetical protein
MSKNNKNQKPITSFFKNPGQAPPIVEIKKEKEEIPKLPSPLGPAPAKVVVSPKKPKVIECPTIQKQPTYETEWINLSDRFLLINRTFDVQYAHLYAERLGSMRKMVTKSAENHWGFFI